MFLSDDQKRMLSGEYGSGVAMSMDLLKKLGEAFDADKMVKADIVHMSTNLPTDMLVQMTEGVNHVRTACSLHAVFNPKLWREKYGIIGQKGQTLAGVATTDETDFEARLSRLKQLGFMPVFTCVPYASSVVLRPGDVFIATGSSGQVAANSIFGARAPRESTSTALASAVTGLTPHMGLLKKENRLAEILINVNELDLSSFNNADYGALGYFIGEVAGIKNVVIDGMPADLSLEQCKFVTNPLPVSGAISLCHIVGVTPEAPSLERALGNKKPLEEIKIGKKEIMNTYEKLCNATGKTVDLVILGCPHCLISEMLEIASLLDNRRVSEGTKLLVATSNATYSLAKDAGYVDIIERAGAIISNCCASAINPMVYLNGGARVVSTNSARGAHYVQRLSRGNTKTYYGDVSECIDSALTGKWKGA